VQGVTTRAASTLTAKFVVANFAVGSRWRVGCDPLIKSLVTYQDLSQSKKSQYQGFLPSPYVVGCFGEVLCLLRLLFVKLSKNAARTRAPLRMPLVVSSDRNRATFATVLWE
jgi:hypothetical protein